MPPVVSVIVPAYDVAPYIATTIASVLAQSYAPFEIIVVNDGSSDTPALEAALAPFHDRLTYIVQPNRGAGAARNTAINASRGDLLAFLDGDDYWEPGYLASQVEFLEHGRYDLVYANARLFGEDAHPGHTYMDLSPATGIPSLETILSRTYQPLTSTTVVRKQTVLEAGLFDEGLRRGQDYDLWVRIAARGARIAFQREVLAGYRIRMNSLSGWDEVGVIDRERVVYAAIQAKLALPPSATAVIANRLRKLEGDREVALGKRELLQGNYGAAAGHLRVAWERTPTVRLRAIRVMLAAAPSLLRALYRRRENS